MRSLKNKFRPVLLSSDSGGSEPQQLERDAASAESLGPVVTEPTSKASVDESPFESGATDLRGSKIRMTSFIGSAAAKPVSVSVPNDLDSITLDEKENRSSTACGQCCIL